MSSKPNKNQKQSKNPVNQGANATSQPKKNNPSFQKDLIDTLDTFFAGKANIFYWISLGLAILLAGFLFDVKVGPGGDDSAYILRAYDFVHSFIYPGYQGPMYPFILSPFILLFGIKLPLLKFLSLIFLVISIVFFYKAFHKRISGLILSSTILLISINYFVLYFASQTYSEALFMMLQSIFFWYFATRLLEPETDKWMLPQYIIIGLILFLMTLTKSIAIAAVIALAGFFLVNRRWKDFLFTSASYISFYGLWEIIKRLIWGNNSLQFASQGSGLMYKDFYNPSLGKEDFAGFIQRFFDNSNLYFSKHLYKFLGFRDEFATEINPFLTILTYALLVSALVYCFRKNKLLFLVGIYVITMCSVEFLVLQKHWDQWRLIIIFYPLILLLIFSSLYFIFKQPRFKAFQILVPILVIIIFFSSFSVTTGHIKLQRPILAKNLEGDLLYGLTPDWVNYIQMSQWAAKNIPQDKKIASRKPEISFIYGERKFTGITKVPTLQPDTFLRIIKQDTSVYMAVRLKRLMAVNMSEILSSKIYSVVSGGFVFGDNEEDNSNVICIYKLTKSEREAWLKKLAELNIYVDTTFDTWIKDLRDRKVEFAITSPDDLLENLRKNEIRYIILGSLRLNPYENTGNIINTIHRYLYFIQLKYPTIFKEIHKIGTDENASLVEVNL